LAGRTDHPEESDSKKQPVFQRELEDQLEGRIGEDKMNMTWMKLAVDILDDAKIKIIRSHPDGNSIVVLWIGLLCLAMKSARPGIIEISDGIPYTIDDLSSAFNIEKKTVELGLALFAKYRMIDLFDGNTIEVINFAKHQSLERIEEKRALNRARVKEYREKRRCNALLTHESLNVTPQNRIDKNRIDKNKKENKESKGIFQIPTIQEISDYCKHRNNKINPELFLQHYTTNGWMVGKNKMKNWKSAIITWEIRGNNGNGNGSGFTGGTGTAVEKAGRARSDGESWPADREY
jgi:predicted phage replisome organizer